MKLYYANASPYARKVRLTIIEKGLSDKVETHLCNPFDEPAELIAANPLGKIPTLITDVGVALYDSRVICEYLDTFETDVELIPKTSKPHWQVKQWEALADGIMDAAYNIVMERKRPTEEQSKAAIVCWSGEIKRTVEAANRTITTLPTSLTLAHLALAAALGYLAFRLADLNWQNGQEALASWYNAFAVRPSMVSTQPK
jgi:glutathione S-transferase